MTLQTWVREEERSLSERLEWLDSQLVRMPEGTLVCRSSAGRTSWIRKLGEKTRYISQKQRGLAEALAYKAYLRRERRQCIRELEAVRSYLKKYDSVTPRPAAALLQSGAYRELLSVKLSSLEKDLEKWENAPYPRLLEFEEGKRYPGPKNLFYRSKSEVMIATALADVEIPFRYECALALDDRDVYPDFMICHPKTGQVYLWEHAGLLDKPDYRRSFVNKLNAYLTAGWFPGQNLIISSESEEHPFDYQRIMELIRAFFVD